MTIDQLNEFINRGGAALLLVLIAMILGYAVFGREKTSTRKSRK